jgi:protein required for attachment to host cells
MVTHWFATADDKLARLFSCNSVHAGRRHVDEHDSLENPWLGQHERGRPSALGRGPTRNAAQHFASVGHGSEEERRRFAHDVASWLRQVAADRKLGRICIFAAPRMLGELRNEIGPDGGIFSLHEAELTHLAPEELAEHPGVVEALV